jgi:ribosomal protein S27E
MSHLDGNAVAGPLSEIFAADITTAIVTCAGCGASGPVATVHVYESAGTVLRCPDCDSVLVRLVRRESGICVEMSGVSVMRIGAG